MKVFEYRSAKALEPFVKAIKIIESLEEIQNRVLPGASIAMAFCFSGQNSYTMNSERIILPKAIISGLRKSVRLINYSQNTSTLIVLFKENGASTFFKEPLYGLFEKSVLLDHIVNPNDVRNVEEMLCEAKCNLQRVKIVEQFLLKRLINPNPDMLISSAVAQIQEAKGHIKINRLADSLHISNDAFEKRFRRNIGSSPKQFASITRMSAIIPLKAKGQLLDIAFDAGFYDQAHFNKDFKLFTGQTPTEFYKSASFW
ncbi:helix-turn-helix domain-containing protein [Chryseobacterium oranimense]|uniref:helix-turn-helix domain-containing protein n=1 Tax=Chryseobacterium oranimense TaxID=421058 RepID=UPI0021AEB8F1|nr:helix-turn-helix domain-containing protein [Chryseobacterium oranimense]UWX60024.1 helix-turn-helix domain-containing protein [Chryseobacterium oranimense]